MNAITHSTFAAAEEARVAKPHEAWEATLAAYHEVKAQRAAARAAREAARRSVYEAVPLPATLIRPDGVAMESEWQIDSDSTPGELRPAMRAALAEWLPQWEAAADRLGYEEREDDELDSDVDEEGEVTEALLECAAPNISALLTQMRIALNEGDRCMYVGEHIDDEETVSRLMSGYWADRLDMLVYRSALRLAGEDSPALRATVFSASDWIDECEERTGEPLTSAALMDNSEWQKLARWRREAVQKRIETREAVEQPKQAPERGDGFEPDAWVAALEAQGVSDVTTHAAFASLTRRQQFRVRCVVFARWMTEEQDAISAAERLNEEQRAHSPAQPILMAAE